MSRGALFAFAVTVSACASAPEGRDVTDGAPAPSDAAADTFGSDTGGPAPLYGAPTDSAPPQDSAVDSGARDAPADDDGGTGALYGAPALDTGVTDDGGPAPLYGAPADAK